MNFLIILLISTLFLLIFGPSPIDAQCQYCLGSKQDYTSLVLGQSAWYLYKEHCGSWKKDLEVLSFEDRSFDPSWKINKWRGDNLSAIAAIVFSTWCHCSHCKQFQEILASRIILVLSGLDCVRLLIPPNKDWILTSRRKHLEILFNVSLDLNIKKLNFILKK